MMYICVKAQKEGLHCYPKAPYEVAFLREMHRHIFHVEVELAVFDDNRELEFFLVQRELKKFLDEIFEENNAGFSCEMIAREVQVKMKDRYPGCTGRTINVRVSEDGENGVYLVDR